MFRFAVRRLVQIAACSRLGAVIGQAYLEQNPDQAIRFIQRNSRKRLSTVDLSRLTELGNFEDLSWLFNCNKANRGIVRLNFDEAAHLFSLTRSIKAPRVLEIGRFNGGGTILFATAMDSEGMLTSIDIAPQDDPTLIEILTKFGFLQKTELVVEDANQVKPVPEFYDIVFIDGDHSYDAASKDYQHWIGAVKVGGHLLFHDFDADNPGVNRLCNEIMADETNNITKASQTGALIDFVKSEKATALRQVG